MPLNEISLSVCDGEENETNNREGRNRLTPHFVELTSGPKVVR